MCTTYGTRLRMIRQGRNEVRLRAVKGELALAFFFVAIGLVWVARALRMPLWEGFAPESGFLPLIYGILLAALSAAVAVQLWLSPPLAGTENLRKPFVVVGALIAAVAALPLAGFVISVFALLFFLYAVVERLRILPALIASAAITGALYVVFRTWLGVPLP